MLVNEQSADVSLWTSSNDLQRSLSCGQMSVISQVCHVDIFTDKDHPSRTVRYDVGVTFSIRNPSGSTYSAPAPFDDDALQTFLAHLSPAGIKLHHASEVRKLRVLAIAFRSDVCHPLHNYLVVQRKYPRKKRDGDLHPGMNALRL